MAQPSVQLQAHFGLCGLYQCSVTERDLSEDGQNEKYCEKLYQMASTTEVNDHFVSGARSS